MGDRSMRTEMIQSHIAQLRSALQGIAPVAEAPLRALFKQQDYAGMVKMIRDGMHLDLRIRVGFVNAGGHTGAPAWVSVPKPMPRLGTAQFRETLVTVFLRKSFVHTHKFEEVAIAIAHELAHVVLFGIGHPLQEQEEAVDLAAMLLGYRDLYVAGSFVEVAPASLWGRIGLFMEQRLHGIERRSYRTLGYLTPEEVRYAAIVMGKPLDTLQTSSAAARSNPNGILVKTAIGIVALSGVAFFGSSIPAPTSSKAPVTSDACAARRQPEQGVYANYVESPGIAPLTIKTESGSNYFIKVVDTATDRPIRTLFVYGGSTLEALVPAGFYVLKYATGDHWCGERKLFGAGTRLHKADQILRFTESEGYTVELIAQRGGNLRTEDISREAF
jgi:hypothetical protein